VNFSLEDWTYTNGALIRNWSLTDCLSFIVMQDNRLKFAVTTDHHFEQAGLERVR